MKRFLIHSIVTTLAILIVTRLTSCVQVDTVTTAVVAAVCLGIVNAVLRPIVLLLTLPLNILSLGLFTLVVNGGMLFLVAAVVQGFGISGLLDAIGAALAISVISLILDVLIGVK